MALCAPDLPPASETWHHCCERHGQSLVQYNYTHTYNCMILDKTHLLVQTDRSVVWLRCSCLFQMIIQVSQLLLSPVALIFCGHLGDAIQLDGAALAISVSEATSRQRYHH